MRGEENILLTMPEQDITKIKTTVKEGSKPRPGGGRCKECSRPMVLDGFGIAECEEHNSDYWYEQGHAND